MKKNFILYLAGVISICLISQQSNAQEWLLAGNSNATAASKLGTTNGVSLRFYTNNIQRMIINSASGWVGVGTSTPVNIFTVQSGGTNPAASWLNGLNSPVFVGFGEVVSSEFLLANASANAANRAVYQGRRSRGSLSAPTAVINNDYITSLLASAYDGGTFQNPALVSFFVDGAPSAGHVPARISFVTGTNSGDRVERLKVGSTGNFNFNNDQIYLRQSDGFVGVGTTSPGAQLDVESSGTAVYGNSTGGLYGVYGNSNYLGVYGVGATYGVYGYSNNSGYGVLGTSGYIGVYGTGSSFGLYGSGGTYGAYANGSSYGVYGSSSTDGSSIGVYGNSTSGIAVYGNSGSNTALRGVTGSYIGVWGSGGYLGCYGQGSSYGVYGGGGTYGVYGYSSSSSTYGVYGYNSGGGDGVQGTNAGFGHGVSGQCTSGSGVYGHSDNYVGVWGATDNSSSYAGYFAGNLHYTGTLTGPSDKNLKQNINDLVSAMDIINKLQPKSYNYRQDGNYKLMSLPTGKHYGLIAQDVEAILPNLVLDTKFDTRMAQKSLPEAQPNTGADSKTPPAKLPAVKPADTKTAEIIDYKSLNYIELIPIVIKGMQEQQTQITKQQTQVDELIRINEDLKNQLAELKTLILQGNNGSSITSVSGYLKQNIPNPAKNNTIISYYLPDNAGQAQIRVTDIKGSVLKVYNAAAGAGQVSIRSGELPAGVYNYTLYANSKKLDTKQMVIMK